MFGNFQLGQSYWGGGDSFTLYTPSAGNMAFIRNSLPRGNVEISTIPTYGNYRKELKFYQVNDYSRAGDYYTYNKRDVYREIVHVEWEILTDTEYTDLRNFIINTAKGATNVFNFYDYDGEVYSGCVFINTESIISQPTMVDYQAISLSILLPANG